MFKAYWLKWHQHWAGQGKSVPGIWSTLKMWILLIFKIASASLLNTYPIGYLFICKIIHQISPSCGVISNCSIEQPWKAVSKFYKNKYSVIWISGFPWWLSHREPACQCRRHRRHGFNPWVRKISWRRKWHSTPVSMPENSHEQRSLAGYCPWGHKDPDMTEQLSTNRTDNSNSFLIRLSVLGNIDVLLRKFDAIPKHVE